MTDQAVDLFDRLVGAMFRKAEGRHARAFQADARAINDKVRLYARVGAALIAARDDKQDAYGAIATVIPWERFRATVAEAEALARPEEFDTLEQLSERYAGTRRWSPAFLDAFDFEGVPACVSLIRAIMVLREVNRSGAGLPKSAPTGFVRQRWAPYVLPGGIIDRRHYELGVLSELRDRLRAGDVWVSGSRQYRSFEERLISAETLQELQQAGTLPIAVEHDFEQFIAGRQASRSSSIGSAKSATAPTRTSSTARPASTCSSPLSSCGTRDIWSAPSQPSARPRMCPTICSPISHHSAGST